MLRRVTLKGFKSIKEMDLELRAINILIGANGAGKSNLVSFFKMLNEMIGWRLQTYIGKSGRAQSLLHFGPKVTSHMEARLEFEVESGIDIYTMRLTYIQLHEFEAYLFADPAWFEYFYDHHAGEIAALQAIADSEDSPELINDGQHSAPSKRIIAQLPDYEGAKPVVGPQVAELIGLDVIRSKCPHFSAWLSRLEQLTTSF
jgi:hypothetical protein